MAILDLISLVSEHSRVRVVDSEKREVALYDGKNSIPNELNDREVVSIRAEISVNVKAEIVVEI